MGDEFSSEVSSARTLTLKGPPWAGGSPLCSVPTVSSSTMSFVHLEAGRGGWLDGCYAEIQVSRLQEAAMKQSPLVFCCIQFVQSTQAPMCPLLPQPLLVLSHGQGKAQPPGANLDLSLGSAVCGLSGQTMD